MYKLGIETSQHNKHRKLGTFYVSINSFLLKQRREYCVDGEEHSGPEDGQLKVLLPSSQQGVSYKIPYEIHTHLLVNCGFRNRFPQFLSCFFPAWTPFKLPPVTLHLREWFPYLVLVFKFACQDFSHSITKCLRSAYWWQAELWVIDTHI